MQRDDVLERVTQIYDALYVAPLTFLQHFTT